MTILSAFFPTSEREPTSPGTTAFEHAQKLWASERTAYSLGEIMSRAGGDQLFNAPYQFLFTAGQHLTKEGAMSNRYRADIAARELTSVREVLRTQLSQRTGALQKGFLQNIEIWKSHVRDPWKDTHAITRLLCFVRMRTLAQLFANQITTSATEVSIAFALHAMPGDAVWSSEDLFTEALVLCEKLAERRPEKKLTREELTRVRDAVVLKSIPHALIVQERIESL